MKRSGMRLMIETNHPLGQVFVIILEGANEILIRTEILRHPVEATGYNRLTIESCLRIVCIMYMYIYMEVDLNIIR